MAEEDLSKELSQYKKFTTLCAFIIVCLSLVAFDSYIGKISVISSTKNQMISLEDNSCSNVDLLYRPLNETCFECFFPSNSTGYSVNNVFRICRDKDSWNRTIKYIETP